MCSMSTCLFLVQCFAGRLTVVHTVKLTNEKLEWLHHHSNDVHTLLSLVNQKFECCYYCHAVCKSRKVLISYAPTRLSLVSRPRQLFSVDAEMCDVLGDEVT